MNENTLVEFLDRVEKDADLRREFAALAARYGFHFTDRELTDEELAGIAGGFAAQPSGPAEVQQQIEQNMNGLLRSVVEFLRDLQKARQQAMQNLIRN